MSLLDQLTELRPTLAAAAQAAYEAWEPRFGRGGCGLVADAMHRVLGEAGIPSQQMQVNVGSPERVVWHFYVLVPEGPGVYYSVDVRWSAYEEWTGNFFRKKPGAVLTAEHVAIERREFKRQVCGVTERSHR